MTTLNLDSSNYSDRIIEGINTALPNIWAAFFGLLVGVLVVRLLVRLIRLVLRLTQIQAGLRDVIASTVEILLWIFLTMFVLQTLGFNNVIVFFSGSVAAIGLAMAAGGSTLISDIIAGIFLARDGDFNVGDEVIAGETPTRGIIESMDARRTRLRDKDGVLHVIPNSVVERKEWILVHKRQELTTLIKAVKTAQRLQTAARNRRAQAGTRKVRLRDTDQ